MINRLFKNKNLKLEYIFMKALIIDFLKLVKEY